MPSLRKTPTVPSGRSYLSREKTFFSSSSISIQSTWQDKISDRTGGRPPKACCCCFAVDRKWTIHYGRQSDCRTTAKASSPEEKEVRRRRIIEGESLESGKKTTAIGWQQSGEERDEEEEEEGEEKSREDRNEEAEEAKEKLSRVTRKTFN
ncbi:hypothetical protein RUM44_002080 [Polyplax serrata]|uniref:Uncharacterized protein n=1 Tax=Polyplax serrata TaxID=468196 RepID=A0ABR1ALV4_POLSC